MTCLFYSVICTSNLGENLDIVQYGYGVQTGEVWKLLYLLYDRVLHHDFDAAESIVDTVSCWTFMGGEIPAKVCEFICIYTCVCNNRGMLHVHSFSFLTNANLF